LLTFLKETAEIETGMAGKSSWDQANRKQKHWFWFELEKWKENWPNYRTLLLLKFFLLII
jgi:hypothetical protein